MIMTVTAKGLEGVVAAETRISDVRGEAGQLVYCGYDINDLAGKICFEEAAYLLWNDRLPNADELTLLKEQFKNARQLPPAVIDFIKAAPKTALPMDVLRTAVSMLGLYDDDHTIEPDGSLSPASAEVNESRAVSITAKIGVIVAYFHRARHGMPLPAIRRDLDEAAHFLYLFTDKEPGIDATKTLDTAYVLHADHGFNASTFAARVTVSTLTDMYSGVVSAIGALKGPLHGGANEAVIHMLEEIQEPDRAEAWVQERLARKQKIMGIGHRVYKTLDPRAPHLKAMAVRMTQELGEPKWIEISEKVSAYMLKEKGLYANVDFYSATVYHSLGVPTDLFTPIFAIARTAGWTAHILEQLGHNRLFRPESEYTGQPVGRKFVPIVER